MNKKSEKIERDRWIIEEDARAIKAYTELIKNKARLALAKNKLEEEQKAIEKAIKLIK